MSEEFPAELVERCAKAMCAYLEGSANATTVVNRAWARDEDDPAKDGFREWVRIVLRASGYAEIVNEFDANVNRLKACEHIADGDEGWEKLRNECPSTAAVARLRAKNAELVAAHAAELGSICAHVTELLARIDTALAAAGQGSGE